jgi:hypothetical protein
MYRPAKAGAPFYPSWAAGTLPRHDVSLRPWDAGAIALMALHLAVSLLLNGEVTLGVIAKLFECLIKV